MNGLVPVLIAVLLAEFGPRASIYADARRLEISLWVIAGCIVATGVAGTLVGPMLTGWADAFLIAIALAFAALGQTQRVKPASGLFAVVAAFWRGGVPLIVFAFATRFGALAAIFGSLAGLVGAAVLTRAARTSATPVKPLRWAAAAILGIAAAVVAIGALRLT